jgi:hypothetical protein
MCHCIIEDKACLAFNTLLPHQMPQPSVMLTAVHAYVHREGTEDIMSGDR